MKKLEERKKKLVWQQRFLYPLLFQDDIYAIAYNRSLNKIGLEKIEKYTLNEQFSFLTLKRLINKIRQKRYYIGRVKRNYNKVFDINCNTYFYSKAIREGFAVILEIFFSVQSEKIFIKEVNKWISYQSIQSVFPFIEDNFLYSDFIINTKIPYFIHPEFLTRILRRRIQDTSFSHLLRLLFYENKKLITLNTNSFFSQKEITRLSLFLWHSFICELEFFLINQCKTLNYFKSLLYLTLLDQNNCIKKIQHIINDPLSMKLQFFFHKKKTSFHYIRYDNNYIIAIKTSNYLVEIWNFFFFQFWYHHFSYSFKSFRMNIKKLSKNCFSFLGYLFSMQTKNILVETKMLHNNLKKDYIIKKELYSITPIAFLIQLLAKEKFCDSLGHPISKLAWTTLTDDEIFNRFDQIWKNFFYYYSGCKNKKNLYQVQYILRFSCAKTLACKHKSTIRYVWKKYGSNFFAKSFFFKKQELISLKFSKLYSSIKKIWYLDIVQVNSLAKLLQRKNTKSK
uniref:Maturase K n=2 Tax=Leucobryum TaxID=80888 RepID=N0DN30_9BRYO|nr:maturase K [Leucobryum scaberulum]BAN16373.1 maturase K [Leucobryum scabrum]BAN16363.1 maturase K [Leucobryum scaberulum]BAN16365.1 maturase K [Leucobryum scaberulum]BAN16374.1 maturase K [Leucobryum scabrum]